MRSLACASARSLLSPRSTRTVAEAAATTTTTTKATTSASIRCYAQQTPRIDPLALVSRELGSLRSSVQSLITSDRPALNSLASYYFKGGSGGKGVRPGLVLLMSRAAASSESIIESDKQVRLAEITELIHVASLLHDDVIDTAESRRGLPSAPQAYGNKLTVLGGDFLLARASFHLAHLGNLRVVELMASALNDLVEGEVLQMQDEEVERDGQWVAYERKMFLKTASLISKSAQSTVVLGGGSEEMQQAAFNFGKHLGLAFQLTDDLLDYTQASSDLGKPASADLSLGLATAPVLFAAEDQPELNDLILRRFSQPGDVARAEHLVRDQSRGLARTSELADSHGQKAIDALSGMRDSEAKRSLVQMTRDVLRRKQ